MCITEGGQGAEDLAGGAKFLLHLAFGSGYNPLSLRSRGSGVQIQTVSIEGCDLRPDIRKRGEVWAKL